MKIRPSQVAATAFMVGYTLFGLICVNLVYTRKNCNSVFYFSFGYLSTTTENARLVEQPQALFEDRYCAGSLHGFYSSLSMFVFGFGKFHYTFMYVCMCVCMYVYGEISINPIFN